MLKGKAKTDYQREYMRHRRAKLKLESTLLDPPTSTPVSPIIPGWFNTVPEIDADGNVIYED